MEGPQLLEAATKGRHEEVARLLSDRAGKAAINYTDEVRETALYKAVTFNHAGIGSNSPPLQFPCGADDGHDGQ